MPDLAILISFAMQYFTAAISIFIACVLLTSCQASYPVLQFNTSAGDMTVRLFDDTQEYNDYFLDHCDQNLFEEVVWTRVVQDLFIEFQAKSGIEALPATAKTNHLPLSGTLALLRSNDAAEPARFFVVHGKKWTKLELNHWARQHNTTLSDRDIQQYVEFGGAPQLYERVTVFGRVERGSDVIDRIASVPHDAQDQPLVPVFLNHVRVMEPAHSR